MNEKIGEMKRKKSNISDIPSNIADIIHFYGVIETPSDIVSFYCESYSIEGNIIRISKLLMDTAYTRKSYIARLGTIFFDKVEFINYMAMFFPYMPYKFRDKKAEGHAVPSTNALIGVSANLKCREGGDKK